MTERPISAAEHETPAIRHGVLRLSASLTGGLRMLLGAALLLMVAVNAVNAVGRYAGGFSLVGADELIVYLMIWVVMTGMIVVTAERRHLALDIVPARLGGAAKAALSLLSHAAMAIACTYAAVQSYAFVVKVARVGQVSMALEIPMAIPHAAVLVGFSCTALVAAVLCVRDIAELAGAGAPDR